MALPARPFRVFIVFAPAATGVTVANVQSLNQPNPLDRLSDVVQPGASRGTKFVFCGGENCPERSIKHLYIPPSPPPVVQEPVMPTPRSIQSPEELSHAKIPTKKKSLKKKRKKPAVQYEYKSVSKPK